MTQNGTIPLTHRQRRAIELLVSGENVSDAAKLARVGRSTLNRWMQDEPFQAALRQAQDQTLSAVARRLVGVAGDALETLHDLCLSADKPLERIRAADALLSHATRMVETVTLAERVSDLEKRYESH